MTRYFVLAACISTVSLLAPSVKAMTVAERACIDQLRAVGGQDGAAGAFRESEDLSICAKASFQNPDDRKGPHT
jgi:hypothetical protein